MTDAISDEISQGHSDFIEVSQGQINTKESKRNEAILDMSQWMSRAALESVGQGILGYSFDPLNSPSTNQYTKAVRELMFVPLLLLFPLDSTTFPHFTLQFSLVHSYSHPPAPPRSLWTYMYTYTHPLPLYSPALFSVSLIRQFAPFLSKLGPPSFRRKIVEWTPYETVQKIKEMSDVMYGTAKGILEGKKRLLTEENDGCALLEGKRGKGDGEKEQEQEQERNLSQGGSEVKEDKMEREGLRDIISGLCEWSFRLIEVNDRLTRYSTRKQELE